MKNIRLLRFGLIIAFIIYFSSGVILAQNTYGRMNGFLRDAETGEPLLYANVSLKNMGIGAASNNAGYYIITNIPPGEYTLQVMMMGYTRTEKTVRVVAGLEERHDFEIKPSSSENGVQVSPSK